MRKILKNQIITIKALKKLFTFFFFILDPKHDQRHHRLDVVGHTVPTHPKIGLAFGGVALRAVFAVQ